MKNLWFQFKTTFRATISRNSTYTFVSDEKEMSTISYSIIPFSTNNIEFRLNIYNVLEMYLINIIEKKPLRY